MESIVSEKAEELLAVLPEEYVLIREAILFSMSDIKSREIEDKLFTKKDISKCKMGLIKSVESFLFNESKDGKRLDKLEKIAEGNSCSDCPFSAVKTSTYTFKGTERYYEYHEPDETPRCIRCQERFKRVCSDEKRSRLRSKLERQARDSVKEDTELFKCKLMINRINRKLNKLKTKKNETC